jgi:hypothetical protein
LQHNDDQEKSWQLDGPRHSTLGCTSGGPAVSQEGQEAPGVHFMDLHFGRNVFGEFFESLSGPGWGANMGSLGFSLFSHPSSADPHWLQVILTIYIATI